MLTRFINYIIGKYARYRYGFKSSVVLTETASIAYLYNQIAKLTAELAFAEAKLHELGYDFETGDTYNPEYEQEFAEIGSAPEYRQGGRRGSASPPGQNPGGPGSGGL